MLDWLRAGSAPSPHLAAWMKVIVGAHQVGAFIEQPLHTITLAQTVCPTSGRIMRPWPLDFLLSQLTRFHIDLVANPLLAALMKAHGWDTPPCLVCGGETEYATSPYLPMRACRLRAVP
jgi:hypothetical protein